MRIELTDSPNCINIQKDEGNELIRITFNDNDERGVLRVAYYSTYQRDYTEIVITPDGIREVIKKR